MICILTSSQRNSNQRRNVCVHIVNTGTTSALHWPHVDLPRSGFVHVNLSHTPYTHTPMSASQVSCLALCSTYFCASVSLELLKVPMQNSRHALWPNVQFKWTFLTGYPLKAAVSLLLVYVNICPAMDSGSGLLLLV